MYIKQNLLSKTLTLGIIILFIGVSYSSAISIETELFIVNNKSEEDFDCQEISNSYLVKLDRMFNRLEVYTKILKFFYINNPDLLEKWEKLSIRISALKDLNNDRPICDILKNIYFSFKDTLYYLKDVYNNLLGEEPLKAFILTLLAVPFAEIWLLTWVIGYEFNCWDEPF